MLFVFHAYLAVLSVPCSFVITCLERDDVLSLFYVMVSCVLSLSHVFWVRCGFDCLDSGSLPSSFSLSLHSRGNQ